MSSLNDQQQIKKQFRPQAFFCMASTQMDRLEAWNFQVPGIVTASLAYSQGYLYVGAWDHRLYCLDGVSGRQVFVFEAEDKILSSPIVANGSVYVADLSGNLYRLEKGFTKKSYYLS